MDPAMNAILERQHKCTTLSSHKAVIQKALSYPQDDVTPGNVVDLQRIYDESRNWIRQVLDEYNGLVTRQGYKPVPDVPPYRESSPRAGLDDNLQWCDDAAKIIKGLPVCVDDGVIAEMIGLFQQLRKLPTSQFPKFDEALLEKARQRAQRIFDRCTARTRSLRRIPFESYWDNPRLQWIASVVAEIASIAKDGPLQSLHDSRAPRQMPIDELSEHVRHIPRQLRFIAAIERVYRLVDPQYVNGLENLQEEIKRVVDGVNKLESTDAWRVIDTFDKFTSGEFQTLRNAISPALGIDRIVESAICGPVPDQFYHREPRESLIDKAIARLEGIRAEGENLRGTLPKSQRQQDQPDRKQDGTAQAKKTNEKSKEQGQMPEKTDGQSLRKWAGAERTTLAIVFTDVVGSTALRNQIGDERMNEMLEAHFRQGRRLIGEHGGREVKTTGDGFLAVFRGTEKALDFAMSLHSDPGAQPIQIRVGIHVGEVTVKDTDQDIDGNAVHFASRVIGATPKPEIWLSDPAKQNIETYGANRHRPLKWERHDGLSMKDFTGTYTLWSLAAPAASSLPAADQFPGNETFGRQAQTPNARAQPSETARTKDSTIAANTLTVVIGNGNVVGDHSSIAMEIPTSGKSKGNLKKTAAAIVAFLAQLRTCSGWLKPIRAFFHWLGL